VDPAIEKGAPQVQDPNVVPPPAKKIQIERTRPQSVERKAGELVPSQGPSGLGPPRPIGCLSPALDWR
jgi:hypothetical protein